MLEELRAVLLGEASIAYALLHLDDLLRFCDVLPERALQAHDK